MKIAALNCSSGGSINPFIFKRVIHNLKSQGNCSSIHVPIFSGLTVALLCPARSLSEIAFEEYLAVPSDSLDSHFLPFSLPLIKLASLPVLPHRMLQSYENSADSGYAASVIAQSHHIELNDRINRWLVGVEQADGTSYTSTPNVKSRRRLSKPYTRAEPHLHRRISSSDTFVEQNLWTPPEVPDISTQEVERGTTETRTTSPVTFRGLDQLPHPHQNPLVRLLFYWPKI